MIDDDDHPFSTKLHLQLLFYLQDFPSFHSAFLLLKLSHLSNTTLYKLSHFISAKILFPKYGDGGQRIARQSRNTEFMRYNYYENLDYIFVHTPESDYLKETSKEKKKRKEKLFVETQDIFNQNRPLVIAPEGTNQSEDNKTPNSPGEFKPGAFLLANKLDPEPLLVPIALANFDYSISKTIYAAVIKEPIKIKDHIKNFNDEQEVNKFLTNYRKKFKKYVEEAIDLAKQIENDNQLGKFFFIFMTSKFFGYDYFGVFFFIYDFFFIFVNELF